MLQPLISTKKLQDVSKQPVYSISQLENINGWVYHVKKKSIRSFSKKLEVVLGRLSRISRPAWANLASQGILTSLYHKGVRNLTLLDMLVLDAWKMGIGCSEAHLHPSSSPSPSSGVSTQQPSNTNLDLLEFTSSHLDSRRLALTHLD